MGLPLRLLLLLLNNNIIILKTSVLEWTVQFGVETSNSGQTLHLKDIMFSSVSDSFCLSCLLSAADET